MRSRRHGWTMLAVADGLDLCTNAEEIPDAVARYKRQLKASRAKEAVAAARARGTRIGRPVEHGVEARRLVSEAHARGASLRQIAAQLTEEGVPTPRGGRWHASTVRSILNSANLDFEAEETRRTLKAGGLEPEPSCIIESPFKDPYPAVEVPTAPDVSDLSTRLAIFGAQVQVLHDHARLLHVQSSIECRRFLLNELAMLLPLLMDVAPEDRGAIDSSRSEAETVPMVLNGQDPSMIEPGNVIERVNGSAGLPSYPEETSVTRVHRLRSPQYSETIEDAGASAPVDSMSEA